MSLPCVVELVLAVLALMSSKADPLDLLDTVLSLVQLCGLEDVETAEELCFSPLPIPFVDLVNLLTHLAFADSSTG